MKVVLLVFVAMACAFPARGKCADDVNELLGVAWESFWQQSGYPRNVYKWRAPIRVKFSGDTAGRHRDFALRQLQAVAAVAGIELTAAAAGGPAANLEVEFFANLNSLPASQPCATNVRARGGIISSAKISANDGEVWRCMLHEAMHAMGIPGHPGGDTVLTYFARGDRLTEADELILKTVYSHEVEPGMYPFAAMAIIARRLAGTVAPGAERARIEQAATAFLRDTVRQMEDFAAGSGEVPVVLLRSGHATAAGVARGRVEMQFFLGLAYGAGDIVEIDKRKGVEWLTRAAGSSHAVAQFLAGDAYFRGMGVERDLIEGYKWCLLAAGQGMPEAKNALREMEKKLQPKQIAEARARAAAWQQAQS